ncbi:hypothetical protein QQF64_030712 [Cirrhinus molitorella]|uniref:Integrase catalytic domain-containing protein n=1 Tax=Cirrhinus molitorella TaxID=172907 RepID=A0ABR3N4C5_9TELE
MLGIRKSRTSPYHPQGDPQPERFNRTLLSMLGTLNPAEKSRWSQHINRLVHAYNCSKNDATGYSPYYLLYGREARLPVDVCFGTSPDGKGAGSHRQYVERMKSELQREYQLATETAQKSQQRNKRLYDRHVKHQTLTVGDRVLIRNLALTGKQKLADRWNSVPYLVVEKLKNLPVYRLKPESGMGNVRTLHRDHLLPVGEDVRLSVPEEPRKVSAPPVTKTGPVEKKQRRGLRGRNMAMVESELRNESESEEDDLWYYHPNRVERQPRTASEARDVSAMEEDTVCRGGELDRPRAEVAEPTFTEEGRGEPPNQSPVGHRLPGLEGGDPGTANSTREVVKTSHSRPRRNIRPIVRLSYDSLGRPTNRPLTLIHRGMVVNVEGIRESKKKPCSTVWCHPMAQCTQCAQESAHLEPRVAVKV